VRRSELCERERGIEREREMRECEGFTIMPTNYRPKANKKPKTHQDPAVKGELYWLILYKEP
jgi:hypothetical protein